MILDVDIVFQKSKMETAEFITTIKGCKALIHQGYKYYKIRAGVDGRVFWRCAANKQRLARVVTAGSNVQSTTRNHNHPPDQIQNKVEKLTTES